MQNDISNLSGSGSGSDPAQDLNLKLGLNRFHNRENCNMSSLSTVNLIESKYKIARYNPTSIEVPDLIRSVTKTMHENVL